MLGAAAPALVAPSAHAQNVSLDGGPQINSYARPGFPVNKILVLGAVGTPGVWQVEQGTDLLEFLTYARVQGIGLRSEGERRRTVVRVYRGGTGPREVVFESEIKPIVERRVTYPVLNEGDVLEVEDIRRLPKRRIEPLQVLGVVTSVLGLVFTVVNLSRTR